VAIVNDDKATAQLMLSDCLGHATHIWGHAFEWAQGSMLSDIVSDKHGAMGERFANWQRLDGLTKLSAPPVEDVAKV
jgi:hypothetical protein